MKFDIKQLIFFASVVEHGSFSKAACSLNVAQASVSERIAGLEEAIGAKLLSRLGRKIELTQTGEILLKRAKEIIALKDKTEMELSAVLGLDSGEIRAGGSTAPGEYMLPKLMGCFAKEYPGVRLRLFISDSEEISERISEGLLEVGVIGSFETRENLIYKKIWHDEIILVVHPEHEWAELKTPITLDALNNAKWITREPGSSTKAIADKALGKIMLARLNRINIVAELSSVTAVKEAVSAGLGVALISLVTAKRELNEGSLKRVNIEGFSLKRYFYLVRDKRRFLSPSVEAFWKFILEHKKC